MTRLLQDKVVLITGGGRGIGRAMAYFCAREGARVVISSRTKSDLTETAQWIQRELNTEIVTRLCDVSKNLDVEELIEQIESTVGPLYGVVAAAGIYGPIGRFHESNLNEWREALEINLMGTVATCHAALKRMVPRREGRLLLMSGGGQGAVPNSSAYVSGKGAILRLTETLGAEYASDGIFVNCLSPGAVNTRFMEAVLEAGPAKAGDALYQKTIKQRDTGGESADKAAALAVYLLSEASARLTGKNISAIWDDYTQFSDLAKMSATDIYTARRVVSPDGRTRWNS